MVEEIGHGAGAVDADEIDAHKSPRASCSEPRRRVEPLDERRRQLICGCWFGAWVVRRICGESVRTKDESEATLADAHERSGEQRGEDEQQARQRREAIGSLKLDATHTADESSRHTALS